MKGKFLYISILCITICMVACKQQKEVKVSIDTETDIVMTTQDTIMVMELATNFMDALKEKRMADAVIMLHKVNKESPYKEPELLDNEELEETLANLKRFPIQNYNFKDFEFKICYDNIIRYDIEIEQDKTTDYPKKLVFALKPVRYLGEWRLCLRN